jgi:enoyl-CoA hydratase
METAPRIRIAAINGLARGGGAEVALARDLRVMAEDADLSFVQIA